MDLDDIIDLAQAAELLGLKPVTLRAHAAAGRIQAKQLTKTWVTTREEVERFRREQLGKVGRPRSPEIYSRIPWPANMYRAAHLQLGAMDPPWGDERAVFEDAARTAIDLGAWTMAEVFSRVQLDPRIHDRLALGFSERPPTIVMGRRTDDDGEPGVLDDDERTTAKPGT